MASRKRFSILAYRIIDFNSRQHLRPLGYSMRFKNLDQPIKLRHRTRLDGIHDVDVGLNGLVVVVAGPVNGYAVFRYPFLGNASKLGISLGSSTVHHDVGRDAEGEVARLDQDLKYLSRNSFCSLIESVFFMASRTASYCSFFFVKTRLFSWPSIVA